MNATDDTELDQLKQEQTILKNQVENFYTVRAKGYQVRSRAKWVEKGEKNSKYFLSLEKKRQANNYIATVKDRNGHNVYENDLILKEVANFYQNLYCTSNVKETKIDEFLNDIEVRHVLSEEESGSCEC
jgi:hypothetical protein